MDEPVVKIETKTQLLLQKHELAVSSLDAVTQELITTLNTAINESVATDKITAMTPEHIELDDAIVVNINQLLEEQKEAADKKKKEQEDKLKAEQEDQAKKDAEAQKAAEKKATDDEAAKSIPNKHGYTPLQVAKVVDQLGEDKNITINSLRAIIGGRKMGDTTIRLSDELVLTTTALSTFYSQKE